MAIWIAVARSHPPLSGSLLNMMTTASTRPALGFVTLFPKATKFSSFHSTCRHLCVSSSSPLKERDRTTVVSAVCKPQRVAIAGAGIAGLSTALALVQTAGIPASGIHIFEPRETLDLRQGAAVNLFGGYAILKREYGISLGEVGNSIRRVVSRNVAGDLLFDIDFVKTMGAYGSKYLTDDHDGSTLAVTVMRDDLQIALAKAVLAKGVTIHWGQAHAIRTVEIRKGKPYLVMADGSLKEGYDLVVGADGVRSNVRNAVVQNEKQPKYTGFQVQWVICKPGGTPPTEALPRGELHQWFGDGGYALHYAAGRPGETTEMLALSHRNVDAVEENVGYRSKDALRERIAHRMEICRMPEAIWNVFERGERFIEVGVHSHPVSEQWSRDGLCVLVGDSGMILPSIFVIAGYTMHLNMSDFDFIILTYRTLFSFATAHAMAPYLGQGANQAIQDAHALALALSRLGKSNDSVMEALQQYESIRRAPTEAIVRSSWAVGWLETQQGLTGMWLRDKLFTFAGSVHGIHRGFAAACTPRFE